MNASRSWKTPSPASPSTSKGQCPLTPDCAPWARRAIQISMALWERSAEGLAFPTLSSPRPPLGDGPRGSRQGVSPCTPHRARGARGYSRENGLAAELPPLGDRPRGSRVWCGSLPLGRWHFEIPPQGVSLIVIHCDGSRIPARAAYAPRQLRGSRAAIGSGGKKARPF